MRAYPEDINVQVGFHRFHTGVQVVENRDELQRMIKWLGRYHVSGPEGRAMGWDPKRDDPETADFCGKFEKMVVVRLLEWP
jgi:hypothetical protein